MKKIQNEMLRNYKNLTEEEREIIRSNQDTAYSQLLGFDLMPKVGSKKFGYSAKGRAAAKRYAKKTGKKVRSKKYA